MEAIKDKGADLFSFMQKRLGDGIDTCFWKDTWNGELPFKLTYPRLYALEVHKNISVADKLAQATLAGTFRREPRSDIEAVQLAKLEDQLEDVQLVNKRDRPDLVNFGEPDLEFFSGLDLVTFGEPDLIGSESRPSMLNKENYVPWSSRLLRYAKSRPNRKLIHKSILNGPYVRRMIAEPGDAERDVNMNETFHEKTDDEISERELKQIEADDQVILTILLDLPEDIYAAVDSCETA
nr:hypothetical protein [Tanacetum cinerariifolium]